MDAPFSSTKIQAPSTESTGIAARLTIGWPGKGSSKSVLPGSCQALGVDQSPPQPLFSVTNNCHFLGTSCGELCFWQTLDIYDFMGHAVMHQIYVTNSNNRSSWMLDDVAGPSDVSLDESNEYTYFVYWNTTWSTLPNLVTLWNTSYFSIFRYIHRAWIESTKH